MYALGLYFALMGSLGGESTPPRDPKPSTEPLEPLDEATYDAWQSWAKSERRRWADPAGPIVPSRSETPVAPLIKPPERGVLGRI